MSTAGKEKPYMFKKLHETGKMKCVDVILNLTITREASPSIAAGGTAGCTAVEKGRRRVQEPRKGKGYIAVPASRAA
eukprot:129623-Pelagomonas_calceolata.AAC.2